MKEYDEADFLPLSGLQHFIFCRRQFALIHIEQQWRENLRTAEGRLLHENAHDGGLLVSRALPGFSRTLGVRGVCDVVEFRADPQGAALCGREGLWRPVPVEYKRGAPKADTDADAAQLCAQAVCLEEMLACEIGEAYLYYGEPKRRTAVVLDAALRERVFSACAEMHELFARRYTPRPKASKRCSACSLADICLPRLQRVPAVSAYVAERTGEEA